MQLHFHKIFHQFLQHPSITDGAHRKENFVEIIPVFSTFSKIFKKIYIYKSHLLKGAQSVTLLSTLRDPTQLRQCQYASRKRHPFFCSHVMFETKKLKFLLLIRRKI